MDELHPGHGHDAAAGAQPDAGVGRVDVDVVEHADRQDRPAKRLGVLAPAGVAGRVRAEVGHIGTVARAADPRPARAPGGGG